MATTRDYLGYLNDKIEIAPANSQEELMAAETIHQIMDEHGLDVQIQEFDAPAGGSFPQRVVMIVLFLGVFLSGLQGNPASIVGIVLVALCGIIQLLAFLGKDVLAGIGPRARSQNVVGYHRAQGPLAAKGTRPIVIVAHYDTARESFLYSTPLRRIQNMLKKLVPILVLVACLFSLLQLVSIIPGGVRRIIWALGIVGTLPLLLLGVEGVYTRFSNCTDGANDNKTGVAAMLGVLGMVRPGPDAADGYDQVLARAQELGQAQARYDEDHDDDGYEDDGYDDGHEDAPEYGDVAEPAGREAFEPEAQADAHSDEKAAEEGTDDHREQDPESVRRQFAPVPAPAPAPAPAAQVDDIPDFLRPVAAASVPAESEPAPAPAPVESESIPQVVTERYEEVKGVRHGRDVLTDLRMLPSSCEIVYVEPQLVSRSVRPQESDRPAQGTYHTDGRFDLISGEDHWEYEAEDSAYDSYDGYEDAAYEEDGPSRFAAVGDKVRGFFGGVKDRFAQLRQRVQRRSEGDEEVEPVERTGVFEAITDQDDAEVLDFGMEEEPVRQESLRDAVRRHHPKRESAAAAPAPAPEPAYREPAPVERSYEPTPAARAYEPAPEPTPAVRAYEAQPAPAQAAEPQRPVERPTAYVPETAYDSESAVTADEVADTAPFEPTPAAPAAAAVEEAPREEENAGLMPGITFENEPDPTEEEMAMRDVSGLDVEVAIDPDADAPQQVEERPRPANVEDPSWGRSEYQPQSRSSFGRRAALYDLPDPTAASTDPFEKDTDETASDLKTSSAQSRPQEQTPRQDSARYVHPQTDDAAPTRQRRTRRRAQEAEPEQSLSDWLGVGDDFNAKSDGAAIGSWDNFSDDGTGTRWKGGAAPRAGLRDQRGGRDDLPQDMPYEGYPTEGYGDPYADSDGYYPGYGAAEGGYGYAPEDDYAYAPEGGYADEPYAAPAGDYPMAEEADPAQEMRDSGAVPGPEELREAILSMGDAELVAHDIWFVALGSSELDHAGIKSFLAEYRKRFRGAFLINLDSVGAGELTTYTREGQFASRRTDRRLERLLTTVAEDLHIPIAKTTCDHADTDATPAMRSSVRAVTITGLTDGQVPALSHTADDVIESVDAAQVTAVTDVVAEIIRRS